MLTTEALKALGGDVQDGLARCLNNEQFYFTLVKKVMDDANFDKLGEALKAGDLKAGFEAAHALKGVLGNLSLTPLYKPVQEMTELLRAGTEADYTPYFDEIAARKKEISALCD